MRHLSWFQIEKAVSALVERQEHAGHTTIYGVPRGGVPVALMVGNLLDLQIVEQPQPGTLVVDDLVDSGRTLRQFTNPVDALYRKPHSPSALAPRAQVIDDWIVFPWEAGEAGPEDAVVRLLSFIGEDPDRPGLQDTPARVVRAMAEMTAGYKQEPADVLARTFDDVCDEMVVLNGIDFTSLCEHHLLPFSGTAVVGYVPGDRVVGLSKLARLVDVFALRLQVQERLTTQIADALMEHLQPQGVGVIVRARHSCMGCRGVRKPGAEMVTSALHGYMKDDPKARAEFLAFAGA